MALPPEPPDEQPPAPPPIDAEGGECPRCGTPYEPFQEYCLECGAAAAGHPGSIPVLATAWRRRVPWYPGDWIWPVLAALLIAALAAAVAILATTDNGSATKTRARAPTDRSGRHGHEPPPPPGTETSPTGTGADDCADSARASAASAADRAATLTEWPPGQNGWTIVLASSPAERRPARLQTAKARRRSTPASRTSACSTPRSSRASTQATSSSSAGSTARRARREARSTPQSRLSAGLRPPDSSIG